ncbi:MAG: hypothetical protein RIC03_06980 [Cyclobacteriaceae bacterium]
MGFASGIDSIKKGAINAGTGEGETFVDVGHIVEDTAQWEADDITFVKHYSEFSGYPIEMRPVRNGTNAIRYQLMDVAADTLIQYLGGTVTDVVDSADEWQAPIEPADIEASFQVTTEDGTVFQINRAKVMAKIVGEPTRNGKFVIDVMAEVLAPLVAAAKPIKVIDNVVTNAS